MDVDAITFSPSVAPSVNFLIFRTTPLKRTTHGIVMKLHTCIGLVIFMLTLLYWANIELQIYKLQMHKGFDQPNVII